jgi:hypothetical protein
MSAAHHLLKTVTTNTRGTQTTVPENSSPRLYHCATLTHEIYTKFYKYKKVFLHLKMSNTYEVKVHIPPHITIKKSLFKL